MPNFAGHRSGGLLLGCPWFEPVPILLLLLVCLHSNNDSQLRELSGAHIGARARDTAMILPYSAIFWPSAAIAKIANGAGQTICVSSVAVAAQ